MSSCDFCRLDRVEWSDVPRCAILAFVGLWNDVRNNRNVWDALATDDRILYFVAILVIALTIRMLTS